MRLYHPCLVSAKPCQLSQISNSIALQDIPNKSVHLLKNVQHNTGCGFEGDVSHLICLLIAAHSSNTSAYTRCLILNRNAHRVLKSTISALANNLLQPMLAGSSAYKKKNDHSYKSHVTITIVSGGSNHYNTVMSFIGR